MEIALFTACHILFSEAIRIPTKFMEVHAIWVVARDSSEKVRAVLGRSERSAERPSFQPETIHGLDGDQGVVFSLKSDVRAYTGSLGVIGIVQFVFVDDNFQDFAVLPKVFVFSEDILLGDDQRDVCHIYKISLNHSHVSQVLPRLKVLLLLLLFSIPLLFRLFC